MSVDFGSSFAAGDIFRMKKSASLILGRPCNESQRPDHIYAANPMIARCSRNLIIVLENAKISHNCGLPSNHEQQSRAVAKEPDKDVTGTSDGGFLFQM